MVKLLLLSAVTALAASAAAHPSSCPQTPTGPKINVIFFSDNKCQKTVPETIYTREVFAGTCTNNFPAQTYSSLIIDHIDDQFIGQNAALQVGNSDTYACNFTNSVKFSIATKNDVGKCQFIGIPQASPGKPLLAGNEYQIAPLQ